MVPDELEPEPEPPDVAPVPEPVLETPVPEPTVPPLVPVLALEPPVPLETKPEPEPVAASVFPVQPALKAQTTTHEIPKAFMGGQYARLLNKCSSEARKSAWGKPYLRSVAL